MRLNQYPSKDWLPHYQFSLLWRGVRLPPHDPSLGLLCARWRATCGGVALGVWSSLGLLTTRRSRFCVHGGGGFAGGGSLGSGVPLASSPFAGAVDGRTSPAYKVRPRQPSSACLTPGRACLTTTGGTHQSGNARFTAEL